MTLPIHSLARGLSAALLVAAGIAAAAPSEDTDVQQSDVRFQSTYVWQRKPAFAAAYTGENSLVPEREGRSYTLTATGFIGFRPWQGGEFYLDPEMTMSRSLSELHGLGGLSNGENQKGGGPNPTFYWARGFLRQTWSLGRDSEAVESAPNQLAGTVAKHRLVLTAGDFSVLDVFDNNSYAHDPRSQFLNWTLMTHGAYDYAADTRGYTWGAAFEYYHDDWALRFGRFEQPIESNGFRLDSRIFSHYGDQIELEHHHELAGLAGSLRLLAFRNRARMGSFQDALDAWRAAGSSGVPSVATVRRERSKTGWGISLEQALTGDLGLFLRASANDGRSETYAFTEVERSLSGGLSLKGRGWGRPDDVIGIGAVANGVSAAHREYLANGGLGPFIGDGLPPAGTTYRYAPERIIETYYSASLGHHLTLSADYQHLANPAYNASRGPASIYGLRLHVEY